MAANSAREAGEGWNLSCFFSYDRNASRKSSLNWREDSRYTHSEGF
jgi:hypothetical protein